MDACGNMVLFTTMECSGWIKREDNDTLGSGRGWGSSGTYMAVKLKREEEHAVTSLFAGPGGPCGTMP